MLPLFIGNKKSLLTPPLTHAMSIRQSVVSIYYYTVINYLRVAEIMADGRIIAVARNNKRLCFRPNDSGLRKARLAERLIYRPRFPRFGDNSSASR